MLREPAVVPVSVTEQLPELRVHEDAESVTLPEPVWFMLTVPVGFEPVTWTVQVVDADTVTVDRVHATFVVVTARVAAMYPWALLEASM